MIKLLTEWWRWVRRKDWELIELYPTTYAGSFPTELRPYFWEVWKDKRTGKERVVACII